MLLGEYRVWRWDVGTLAAAVLPLHVSWLLHFEECMSLCRGFGNWRKSLVGLMVAMAGFAAPAAFAAGAPAGAPIPNAATLTYSIAGWPATPVTAVAPVLVVAEVINVVLTWQDGTPVPVNSPEAGKALTFVLTNTGNGAETFGLARNNVIAGDQFDPANAAAGAIYFEKIGRASCRERV